MHTYLDISMEKFMYLYRYRYICRARTCVTHVANTSLEGNVEGDKSLTYLLLPRLIATCVDRYGRQ